MIKYLVGRSTNFGSGNIGLVNPLTPPSHGLGHYKSTTGPKTWVGVTWRVEALSLRIEHVNSY